MALPFVSVVVPVFNGRRFVKGCLESLLNQDYPKDRYEILVVDSGSTDETQQEVSHYPVKLISRLKPRNPGASRNAAIMQARGELIAFTDIDCIADPGWLKHLISGWEDFRYGGFAGRIEPFPTNNMIEQWMAQFYNQEGNLRHRPFPFALTNNMALRRELFTQIGGFDENLLLWHDVEFGWRLHQYSEYKYRWNPQALVYHRNLTTLTDVAKKFFLRGYSRAAARKRIPQLYQPAIAWLVARHSYGAFLQLGKVAVRVLIDILSCSDRTALLRTEFWFMFHASTAIGLAVGACDWRNRKVIIPYLIENVHC